MRGQDPERGIILAIDGRDAVVLTPAGEFRRVRLDRPGRQVGEEIPLPAARAPLAPRRFFWPGAATVVAAALLALAILPAARPQTGSPMVPGVPGTGTVAALVTAYVTVDINPSFELAVDDAGRVVSTRALNADAEPLLARVDLAGRPVEEAVALLAEAAAESGFLAPERENNVVIAAVPAAGNPDVPPAVREQVRAGRRRVEDTLARRALAAEVVALAAPAPELKAEAAQAGLSVGKYLIWLEMRKSGLPATAEELRDRPIGKVIREFGLAPGEVIRRPEKEEEMKALLEAFRARLRSADGEDGGQGGGESRQEKGERRRTGADGRERDGRTAPGGEDRDRRGQKKDENRDDRKDGRERDQQTGAGSRTDGRVAPPEEVDEGADGADGGDTSGSTTGTVGTGGSGGAGSGGTGTGGGTTGGTDDSGNTGEARDGGSSGSGGDDHEEDDEDH